MHLLGLTVAALLGQLAAAAPSVPARAAADQAVCSCPGGISVGANCFDDLATAAQAANGATISITGQHTVTSPLKLDKGIALAGTDCAPGQKATLTASMDAGEGAMLEFDGPTHQTISVALSDICFNRAQGSGHAAVIRGGAIMPADGDQEEFAAPTIDLAVSGCEFRGFSTIARGGSAIYLMRPGQVNIDSSTVFDNNVVEENGEHYGGGGALWMIDITPSSNVQVDATFTNNVDHFGHGLGGGMMLDSIYGKVRIGGRYSHNQASDGGGVHVAQVLLGGYLDINAAFESNEAVEMGYGARAGAVRLQYIYGTVVADGSYTGNKSGGRGGVYAINRIYSGAQLTIRGSYVGNEAATTGGVLDEGAEYAFANGARLTVESGCTFNGNVAKGSEKTSILDIGPLHQTLAESEWQGATITYQA